MSRERLRLCRYDVVLAAVRVGESMDPRRCIVIEAEPDSDYVTLQPCSSAADLFNAAYDTWVEGSETEFRAAGFPRRSYAVGPDNPKGGLARVRRSQVRKVSGHLGPEQKRALCDRYGFDP